MHVVREMIVNDSRTKLYKYLQYSSFSFLVQLFFRSCARWPSFGFLVDVISITS